MSKTKAIITEATKQVQVVKLVAIDNELSGIPLLSSEWAGEVIQKHIGDDASESLLVLFLDVQNKVIAYRRMFSGTLTQAVVSPREIMQTALLCNACRIITGHNHPSGSLKPSQEDITTNQNLIEASDLMGISLIDNFIVTSHDYLSFAEDGLM